MNFPETIIAGDTLDFTVSVPDYPASAGWTLKYRLTPRFASPVQAAIAITATTNANGLDYNVQAAPSATAAYVPGEYTWARWVEKSGARQTLDESGPLLVKPDPALTAQGLDSRTHARKMLALIETALEAFAANPVMKSYAIGARQYMRADIPDLLVLRDRYRNEAANEDAVARIAAGAPNPRNIGVRFNRV